MEKHDLNKRQTSVKLYISLTLAHSVDRAMYTLLHSHVKQFLSLLPKANSSEITVLLLTPQHSSTNPKKPRRLEPMLCWMGYYSQSEAIRGPTTRAQCREFTSSQKQQPNRWPLESWRRPHCECSFFFFFKLSLKWPKYRPPCLSELRLTALKPSEIQDNTSPSSNVNVGSLLSPYLKFKANI